MGIFLILLFNENKWTLFLEAKISRKTFTNVASKTSIINTHKFCRKEG